MAGNRVITFMEPFKLQVETIDYPKLANPQGKKIERGAILKIVATNICGSDQHIYHGRFAAPQGMVMGHEMTGEVVEVGRDVKFIKMGDLCSVPFNVSCGRCRNCKERHTDMCMNVNDQVDCGAYGFNLGNWQGGQADYLMVPYADWNLRPNEPAIGVLRTGPDKVGRDGVRQGGNDRRGRGPPALGFGGCSDKASGAQGCAA